MLAQYAELTNEMIIELKLSFWKIWHLIASYSLSRTVEPSRAGVALGRDETPILFSILIWFFNSFAKNVDELISNIE